MLNACSPALSLLANQSFDPVAKVLLSNPVTVGLNPTTGVVPFHMQFAFVWYHMSL